MTGIFQELQAGQGQLYGVNFFCVERGGGIGASNTECGVGAILFNMVNCFSISQTISIKAMFAISNVI
jgi:hypothetical protein